MDLDLDAASKLCELLPDGVLLVGADQRVLKANEQAARLLGTPLDDLIGTPYDEALPFQDEDGRDWAKHLRPFNGLPTRTALVERLVLLPDGTELLVSARLNRPTPGGPVEAMVVALRSARQRELLERERSDLIATVAHELRSPLTGVKGFVTTLISKWDRLNEQQKLLMLQTVQSDSERLGRLITELLDVARIDTNRLSLYPRELDLEVAVSRVVSSVRMATARPIRVETQGEVPDVFFDPDKLAQVLTNVVENAVRHGEGAVTIRLAPTGPEAPWPGAVVTVEDEGRGIPPDIRSRVFTKFWTSGARGGSGLGLYIVQGLMRAHGGEVAIEDATTHTGATGARVVLTIPREDRRHA